MSEERCPDVEFHYRRLESYAMALALHDALGWSIAAYVVDVPLTRDRSMGHVMHAWLQAPDGTGFDVGGHFDERYLEDMLAASASNLPARVERFDTGDDFFGFLRDSAVTDARWNVIAANLEAGRDRAAEVVRDYVLRVHPPAEGRRLALN